MQDGLRIENAEIRLTDGDRAFALCIDALSLPSGRAVALTGASGSGKTLLLELLGLLRVPGAGTRYVRVAGTIEETDLAGLWQTGARSAALAQARGRLFGFVPQTGGLMPFLSVAENIALPQRIAGRVDPDWKAALIARLGLEDVAALLPGALSIGQRQRTAIARSLAHRPAFVIADEPTAALDPESADTVLGLFLEMAAEQGSGVILSSHDRDRIGRFGIPRLHLHTQAEAGGLVQSRLQEELPC